MSATAADGKLRCPPNWMTTVSIYADPARSEELRTYGRGLEALDRGEMQEARRILATLPLQRPDFAQVQRGLGQLSQRIQQLLSQPKFAPERVLALAAQVEAGQTDACVPLFSELVQFQTAFVKAISQPPPSSPNAGRSEAGRILAGLYAVTLRLLDRPALNKPICMGNQSAAGTALSLLLFTIWPTAKQVVDCHPVTLEQLANPERERASCERSLRRLVDIRDADDKVLIPGSDFPTLLVQLGQIFVERHSKEPYAPQLLPVIQSHVEFLQLAALTGPARQQGIARAILAKARQILAQEGDAGMMLAMVQLPAKPQLVERLRPATVLVRLRDMRDELAMATARIELSTDGGAKWAHTWPLATEPAGYSSAADHKPQQPPTRQLVGDGGYPRGNGVFQINTMHRWYRDVAWLGPAWTEATFADLRMRLVALDDSELMRCTVGPDPVANRTAQGDSTYGRVECFVP